MNRYFVVLVAALVATMTSSAYADEKVTGTIYAGPSNKYLFRGLDLSDNQWVMQGGVDLNYRGFTLSYWSNFQTRKTANLPKNNVTETDIILNYSITPVEIMTLNLGNSYYGVDSAVGADTNELYLKATANTLLSPTATVYWDWDEATGKGLFYTFGISHNQEIATEISGSLSAQVGYNMENPSASAGYTGFHNFELCGCIDYSPIDKVKISPSYTFSNALSASARSNGLHRESLFGLKMAYNF